jgi:hypothetical protein
MTESCSVGPQLVSDDRPWGEAILLQQLPHQLQRCPLIPLGLNQNVKHLAILINCTPEIPPAPADRDIHFIEVP